MAKGNNFYRDFEDRFRGSKELITSRLEIYMPFVLPMLAQGVSGNSFALDLGCGRGEWLELLANQGFNVHGVDVDDSMMEEAKKTGLPVTKMDALEYIKSLPDESVCIVSGFHIVEHVSFEKLQKILSEALRILIPGGLLIFETPNPENIVVASWGFHMDPTHLKPLPPPFLEFVVEHAGFERSKILRLQESPELHYSMDIGLMEVLEGVSPDYAIIGQKSADGKITRLFDNAFHKNYGLSLSDLGGQYENYLDHRFNKLETLIEESRRELDRVRNELESVYSSKAWVMVGFIRYVLYLPRSFKQRIYCSENIIVRAIRKGVKRILNSAIRFVMTSPGVKRVLKVVLNKMTFIKRKIQKLIPGDKELILKAMNPSEVSDLHEQAKSVYLDLENIARKRKGS